MRINGIVHRRTWKTLEINLVLDSCSPWKENAHGRPFVPFFRCGKFDVGPHTTTPKFSVTLPSLLIDIDGCIDRSPVCLNNRPPSMTRGDRAQDKREFGILCRNMGHGYTFRAKLQVFLGVVTLYTCQCNSLKQTTSRSISIHSVPSSFTAHYNCKGEG